MLLRVSHTTISSGLTAAHDKLFTRTTPFSMRIARAWKFSISPPSSTQSDIFTKKRNKLYPAMTKMVAVVKDKVRRISPGDDESGVDSDNEMIEDEAELSGQLQREMNDSSDENSEEGESGSTRIS
ncbi:hypothetical protein JCM33374_g2211 [Metschnikowia sp. JCM 33374]|nr:hypothetical protein JCM33374_g2211 [Metschnikowia sp. JCM 33374]